MSELLTSCNQILENISPQLIKCKISQMSIDSLKKRISKLPETELKGLHTKLVRFMAQEINVFNYAEGRHDEDSWKRLIEVFQMYDAPEYILLKSSKLKIKEVWNEHFRHAYKKSPK